MDTDQRRNKIILMVVRQFLSYLDDVEPGPGDVVAEHLEVGELGHGVGLDRGVGLPQLGLDLLEADGDVLGLVLLVVADAPDEVVEVLVEQPLQIALYLHQSHFGELSSFMTFLHKIGRVSAVTDYNAIF